MFWTDPTKVKKRCPNLPHLALLVWRISPRAVVAWKVKKTRRDRGWKLSNCGNSGRDTFFSKKNKDIPENFRADLIPFGEFLYMFLLVKLDQADEKRENASSKLITATKERQFEGLFRMLRDWKNWHLLRWWLITPHVHLKQYYVLMLTLSSIQKQLHTISLTPSVMV